MDAPGCALHLPRRARESLGLRPHPQLIIEHDKGLRQGINDRQRERLSFELVAELLHRCAPSGERIATHSHRRAKHQPMMRIPINIEGTPIELARDERRAAMMELYSESQVMAPVHDLDINSR
jgi:hypothetical protein